MIACIPMLEANTHQVTISLFHSLQLIVQADFANY
jgi:hypothetical protein